MLIFIINLEFKCKLFQRNEAILDLIGREYKQTGRCDFAIAKKKYITINYSLFDMRKNWPYTREVTIV